MARWKFWSKSRVETDIIESDTAAREDDPQDPARARFLRNAAAGLTATVAGAVAAGLGASTSVKAATNDPVLLGHSGDTADVNLAEQATEVQFDGAVSPGVVLLAQADNKWTPAAAGFPAALAGWTSINPDIPNGVYGYTEQIAGTGVVGWGNGPDSRGVLGQCFDSRGLGGAFIGPNRAPLNLRPEAVPMPPPTGQAGDLYVTINVDNFATLWFHTGISGWKRVSLL